jgi:hypothetical protein
MQKFIILVALFIYVPLACAQNTSISGIAPSCVGKTIELFGISDYFSNIEKLIASTTVKEDSSFTFNTNIRYTQKIIIRCNKNKGFMFVEPNAHYSIYYPKKNKYDPYKATGNDVEVAFLSLDSSDINYKILGFQRWVDNFLGVNYYRKSLNHTDFLESLERFKSNVEKAYKNDSSNYFKTHVKFTIAGLDNIKHSGERNRYEKHDFYIKYAPVAYNNEAYMLYISDFYQKLMPRLSQRANEEVYSGVLKSSPTLIMKALGSEYTLVNLRIRELVMIKSLGEMYYSEDFPKTNIKTILDSLSINCLFQANEQIAKNIRSRITTLVPGGKAPDFALIQDTKSTKTLYSYAGKHLYLHFFDPESEINYRELSVLKELQQTYGEYVQFVSIYRDADSLSSQAYDRLNSISWDSYKIPDSNPLWKNYCIKSYPQYTLIDPTGYIVACPALGPTANGLYETIDKTFFYIKRQLEGEE